MDRLSGLGVDWNLFKTFCAIAEYGGVSAAARALHREQPSVSAALKRLEQHYGTALCKRTSRGVVLTPAGQAIFEASLALRQTVQALPAAIAKVEGGLEATLSLRMISDVIAPRFDQAMTAFHRAYPNVEIKIDIAPWRSVLDALHREEVILGIACDSAPSDDLLYHPVVEEIQQLYCGAAHPLCGSGPYEPAHLASEIFVMTGDDEPDELLRFRRTYSLGRRSGGIAETLYEARRLIQMGIGIGFMPTAVAERAAPAETLWPLLVPNVLPRYPLYLITKRDAKRTAAMHHLIDALFAEIPPTEP